MSSPNIHSERNRHVVLFAAIAALFVGFVGVYPHVQWSLETGQPSWFFSSYDEGYYGWLSLKEISLNRGLSDIVMHALYLVSGMNSQRTMILADFVLPFGATLAACYMVRPFSRGSWSMVAGALLVLVSAECLALRSNAIPYTGIHTFLTEKLVPISHGIIQLENQTSTFWLFRTPEPQVSWSIMFLGLGLLLRFVSAEQPTKNQIVRLAAISVLAGSSYVFCALTFSGTLLLYSTLAFRTSKPKAIPAGVCGVFSLVVCLALSSYAARTTGGGSLLFESRVPVLMLNNLSGLIAVGWIIFQRTKGSLPPLGWLALALGLTPLCLANQQLITGRMIYLLNFENYGLAQISALALLTAAASASSRSKPLPPHWINRHHLFPILTCLLLSGLLLQSQRTSYQSYLQENRLGTSYEVVLNSLPKSEALIVCADFFQTDTLPLRLGFRPNFLLSRDLIFSKQIGRLTDPNEPPLISEIPRLALYHYLSLTGVSPEEFSEKFDAITDPKNPDWQNRFLVGGFLYNHADFWSPLTHGRDVRLDLIKLQKPMIIADYTRSLHERNWTQKPAILVMRQEQATPAFAMNSKSHPLQFPPTLIPMKAYLIENMPFAELGH